MAKSKIDWCDDTWNPVSGCRHGCPYCYAREFIHRFGDKVLYGHLGSAPPFSSSLFTDPASGYAVALMINTECNDLRYKIPELILTELTK